MLFEWKYQRKIRLVAVREPLSCLCLIRRCVRKSGGFEGTPQGHSREMGDLSMPVPVCLFIIVCQFSHVLEYFTFGRLLSGCGDKKNSFIEALTLGYVDE